MSYPDGVNWRVNLRFGGEYIYTKTPPNVRWRGEIWVILDQRSDAIPKALALATAWVRLFTLSLRANSAFIQK